MSNCKVVSVALAGCLLAVQANAQTEEPWDFYGRLNLGFLTIDDGAVSETYFTDNDNSNSRIGLIYSIPGVQRGELRFHFETGLGFSGSSEVTPVKNEFSAQFSRTELRKLEVKYDSPSMGMFSFGQGSMATDGVGESDFSGTSVVQYSAISDLGGATFFRLEDGRPSRSFVAGVFQSLDGGRRFRARYDTPELNGFTFAAAVGREVLRENDDSDYADISGTYTQENDAYKLTAGLGYEWIDERRDRVVGSAAILHKPTGWNAAFAGGAVDDGGEYIYAKVGIIRDWISAGSTAVSVDYYDGSDFGFIGSEANGISLAVVQRIDRHNLELYGLIRTLELESTLANYRDINVSMIGARWRF